MTEPEDVFQFAEAIDWESVLIIGCDSQGNINSLSSRMTLERLVLLLETTKHRLFSGQFSAQYDA